MKWSNSENDPGMDDRELFIESAFWIILAAAVIALFYLGFLRVGG